MASLGAGRAMQRAKVELARAGAHDGRAGRPALGCSGLRLGLPGAGRPKVGTWAQPRQSAVAWSRAALVDRRGRNGRNHLLRLQHDDDSCRVADRDSRVVGARAACGSGRLRGAFRALRLGGQRPLVRTLLSRASLPRPGACVVVPQGASGEGSKSVRSQRRKRAGSLVPRAGSLVPYVWAACAAAPPRRWPCWR